MEAKCSLVQQTDGPIIIETSTPLSTDWVFDAFSILKDGEYIVWPDEDLIVSLRYLFYDYA